MQEKTELAGSIYDVISFDTPTATASHYLTDHRNTIKMKRVQNEIEEKKDGEENDERMKTMMGLGLSTVWFLGKMEVPAMPTIALL